ncbi:carbohydrate-binding module family 13 protein [Rhizophagus clarus]|nr:carbohydrate-binding module family 13 protein [Rhizophagus clarus]
MILRYIYGGKLSLEEYDTSDIIKILIASNELSLQELITHLQLFLIENKKDWMERNFNMIYKISFENNSFSKLQNFCTKFMSNVPERNINPNDFTSLSEKSLISHIKNDIFQKNVIKIWENVLKWGISQNPELPSNPSNYSKDNFYTLKITLKQVIPFIKFLNLNNKEFLDKVYPYKKILPKDLREKLVKHYLNYDYRPIDKSEPKIMTRRISLGSIDSKIITSQHAELITKWIDGLRITDNMKNSYKFNLILRGSRDGFSTRTFHMKCDRQPRTITVIKVKGSNEILGGYNPIAWSWSDSFGFTTDSFIFSFKNKGNIENYVLSHVRDTGRAIENSPALGPSFGCDDLYLNGYYSYDKSFCRYSRCYDKAIRETEDYFTVEDYEIFQIMKS